MLVDHLILGGPAERAEAIHLGAALERHPGGGLADLRDRELAQPGPVSEQKHGVGEGVGAGEGEGLPVVLRQRLLERERKDDVDHRRHPRQHPLPVHAPEQRRARCARRKGGGVGERAPQPVLGVDLGGEAGAGGEEVGARGIEDRLAAGHHEAAVRLGHPQEDLKNLSAVQGGAVRHHNHAGEAADPRQGLDGDAAVSVAEPGHDGRYERLDEVANRGGEARVDSLPTRTGLSAKDALPT